MLISIHALLAESDYRRPGLFFQYFSHFYPRSPCGERPRKWAFPTPTRVNFYPRSPCGERRWPPALLPVRRIFLSTLSLRRATHCRIDEWQRRHISIHALLAESDVWPDDCTRQEGQFLSTLSLRRATVRSTQARPPNGDFYPRSPCGERQFERYSDEIFFRISIHALLAESDVAAIVTPPAPS